MLCGDEEEPSFLRHLMVCSAMWCGFRCVDGPDLPRCSEACSGDMMVNGVFLAKVATARSLVAVQRELAWHSGCWSGPQIIGWWATAAPELGGLVTRRRSRRRRRGRAGCVMAAASQFRLPPSPRSRHAGRAPSSPTPQTGQRLRMRRRRHPCPWPTMLRPVWNLHAPHRHRRPLPALRRTRRHHRPARRRGGGPLTQPTTKHDGNPGRGQFSTVGRGQFSTVVDKPPSFGRWRPTASQAVRAKGHRRVRLQAAPGRRDSGTHGSARR